MLFVVSLVRNSHNAVHHFEIGRVALVNYGKDYGKLAMIVDFIDWFINDIEDVCTMGSAIYQGMIISYRELPVVIKIMRSIRNRKADIQKEITLLSEVHDPSIVKFIGASDHPPFVILTELMEGGSLRDYLQSL
ncbi:tyrosine-protein kinase ABL1-like, partial [Macadamia integrifolia]|uniref:tyrosine-protein kinase ABL1-like n=1 Tax=Macadamia integrifolia TaxID=60698 RepID=UPI001C500107